MRGHGVYRYTTSQKDDRGRTVILWRYIVDLPPGADGKRRQKRKSGFETKDAAERALRAFRSEMDSGDYIEPATVTVSQQVDLWLRGRRRVQPTTLRGYRIALAYVTDNIGTVAMQSLAPAHVEAVVQAMAHRRPRPLSPRSISLTLGLFRRVCRDAVRDGVIRRNPAEYVEAPAARHREMLTWTPEEMQIFADLAESDRLAPAWRFTLAGLRRSEVLGLRWSDLDLETGSLTVAQARVSFHDDTAELRTRTTTLTKVPKTERARRRLPLDSAFVAALRTYRAQLAAERLIFGSDYDTSHDLVVVDERGAPLRPEFYSDEFRRLSVRAGVSVIRLHDARHTCATYLHASGLPAASISAWLGHASAAFTMRTYIHAQDAGFETASELLSGSYARSL